MKKPVKHDNLLGEISFPSGLVLVTDPCYIPGSLTTDATVTVEVGVAPFQAVIELTDEGHYGVRVENLLLLREFGRSVRESLVGTVYVDSGQMSALDSGDVFQFDHPSGPLVPNGVDFGTASAEARGQFGYLGACDLTLNSPDHGGILDGRMFVTESGFGDGEYPVYVGRDSRTGEVRSVRVSFLEDDEDESY